VADLRSWVAVLKEDRALRVAAHRYRLLFTHEWNEEVLARLRDAEGDGR